MIARQPSVRIRPTVAFENQSPNKLLGSSGFTEMNLGAKMWRGKEPIKDSQLDNKQKPSGQFNLGVKIQERARRAEDHKPAASSSIWDLISIPLVPGDHEMPRFVDSESSNKSSKSVTMACLVASPELQGWSAEELRLRAYTAGVVQTPQNAGLLRTEKAITTRQSSNVTSSKQPAILSELERSEDLSYTDMRVSAHDSNACMYDEYSHRTSITSSPRSTKHHLKPWASRNGFSGAGPDYSDFCTKSKESEGGKEIRSNSDVSFSNQHGAIQPLEPNKDGLSQESNLSFSESFCNINRVEEMSDLPQNVSQNFDNDDCQQDDIPIFRGYASSDTCPIRRSGALRSNIREAAMKDQNGPHISLPTTWGDKCDMKDLVQWVCEQLTKSHDFNMVSSIACPTNLKFVQPVASFLKYALPTTYRDLDFQSASRHGMLLAVVAQHCCCKSDL